MTPSSPHRVTMGTGDRRIVRIVVFRLSGQASMGPSEVEAQSWARTRAPVSPVAAGGAGAPGGAWARGRGGAERGGRRGLGPHPGASLAGGGREGGLHGRSLGDGQWRLPAVARDRRSKRKPPVGAQGGSVRRGEGPAPAPA